MLDFSSWNRGFTGIFLLKVVVSIYAFLKLFYIPNEWYTYTWYVSALVEALGLPNAYFQPIARLNVL